MMCTKNKCFLKRSSEFPLFLFSPCRPWLLGGSDGVLADDAVAGRAEEIKSSMGVGARANDPVVATSDSGSDQVPTWLSTWKVTA